MSITNFIEKMAGKKVTIYMCDMSDNIECIVKMDPIFDYVEEGARINIYDQRENMVSIPADGKIIENEDGEYKCLTEGKIFLFYC